MKRDLLRVGGMIKRNGYLKSWSLITALFLTMQLNAIEKNTLSQVSDETITIEVPFELHITATENAIVNSTIHLNHMDAWVFFDNIPPDQVTAAYLSSIKINGSNLINGGNARIAIYGNGSVVIPHPAGLKPLTLYDTEGFEGDSMQFETFTYHTELGDFNRKAKSFWLKRGYMATLATNEDGTGYSRVFIADKEDIRIDALQAELNGTVAFVRVFKYQWVSKKGKAGWDPHILNGTTYYDWNIGGSSSTNVEYVAIRQNAGWPSWSSINTKTGITHLLGYNEPDRPDQADMTLQQCLDGWPGMLNSGFRIGSPAWSNAFSGDFFSFIDQCDEMNYRVDFVALHCYWGGKSAQAWYNDLKYIHDRTGRPLWITEWNNGANWTTEWWPDASRAYTDANAQKQLTDMMAILQVLDTASFVERYFIYDWVEDCRAMVLNNGLTLAGEYYAANKSEIAYDSRYEVIPAAWNYEDPTLSYQYLSLSNKINLRINDPNGNLSKGFRIEKKANDGNFEVLYETEDVSLTSFSDDLDSTMSGKISYRVSVKTIYDEYIKSNEVSYYQSGGTDTLQIGIYPYNNMDWNTTLFSTEFDGTPHMITGIPSFNNITALTHRINSLNTKNYKFQLDPWSYQANPTMTKDDYISMFAMRAGSYDFGGLKTEVGSVVDVEENWVNVTFNQSFDSVPVVFCTQVTNKTYTPTTIAIRNVTTSGFEVKVRCEENISQAIIAAETLHFMAIEEGEGALNNYRLTVGSTGDGPGINSDGLILAYDSSYVKPAVFASLLSAEDNFASTLRYYQTTDFEYNILKQREMSGPIVVMKRDKLGWMIMDLSEGQVIESVGNYRLPELAIYPNPVNDILYIDYPGLVKVEVLDLHGRVIVRGEVETYINLESLNPGIYILKAEGFAPGKFIKK